METSDSRARLRRNFRRWGSRQRSWRVSRWEKMESNLGRDRTLVDRATRRRDHLRKEAFTDSNYNPPKPRAELVTKQGNRVHVVKWTPQLTRPESTHGAAGDQPSGDAEEEPPLIWTRETSPVGGPLRPAPPSTTQAGRPSTGHGRTETAASGAGMGPTTGQAPAGQLTVCQVLNELLTQATQQLAAALPNWAATPSGVAQLQALMQDVLARAEALRPGITNRTIPWTPPSSPGNEHFPPALYVGAPGEYAVGGADPTPLLSLAEHAARAMLARRVSQLPAHTGTRLNEWVRAPIFNTGAREIWVNGKPLEGIAILDTGAMPLLIGRAGMAQMGWTDKETVPNAVRLGLADGHSTNLHGLTRKTVKFDFNPRSPTKISIAVRAVVTDAPYDFLVGNIILWTIGATLDAWREELRYRVDWLKGPSLADDREGRVSIVYTRDPGPPVLPAAQFCAPAWAVPTGGGEAEEEEDRSLPDLHDGTESEGGSQEFEEEAVDEGPEERTPVELEVNQSWMMLPWERECAPNAGRNLETGRMVLSLLPSREYRGPDYENEGGAPHIYALRRRFFADVIELHVFRSTEAVVPPPGYEVVARVERDAAGNCPR
jgi:hypothetical protein